MESIRKVFLSHENILIHDNENKLWLVGDNNQSRIGLGIKENAIYSPVYTKIILDDDEEVVLFHAYSDLLAIYTSNKKLFVSFPEKQIKKESQNMQRYQSFENRSSVGHAIGTPLRGIIEISNRVIEIDDDDDEIEPVDNDSDVDGNDSCDSDSSYECSNPEPAFFNDLSDSDTIFNNYEYFLKLKYYFIKKEYGILLLESEIENIKIINETIYFQKDGELCVFNHNLNNTKMIVGKNYGISTKFVNNHGNKYYKLVIPFAFEKILFMDRFIYANTNGYHHIFSSDDEHGVVWIYFRMDFEITPNQIYYSDCETIYVKHGNAIYKYSHVIHEMKEFISDAKKTFIIPSYDDDELVLFCLKDNGLYLDNGDLHHYVDYNEMLENIVDCNTQDEELLIIVNCDEQERYKIIGSTLYFNVNRLLYYKLMNTGFLFYDDTNTLYFCTNINLSENKYGTTEIEKITLPNGRAYYLYIFNNLPSPITNISFTGSIILVQSNNQYYYHVIESYSSEQNFLVNKFTEIIISQNNSKNDLINKNYIMRSKKTYDYTITLSISQISDKFKRLLCIMEMLRQNIGFEIEFVRGITTTSYGDGPKREFMENAIQEFGQKYLTKHNNLCEFNIDELNCFNDDELVAIGIMIHAVINHSNDNLSIKLPISLMVALKDTQIKLSELEYFANLEDPELFASIFNYKNDPLGFEELNSDYGSYSEYIKSICKYRTDERTVHVSKMIAQGVLGYENIKNLSIMNYPTLDYYLSGDYTIDRDLLLKKIRIQNFTNDEFDVDYYKQIIFETIRNLSPDKLVILLKNWSGTSLIKKSSDYVIEIVDSDVDVTFRTCDFRLIVNIKAFAEEYRNLLLDILVTPYNIMVDN